MTLPLYLAMTNAEISANRLHSGRCAYMACHFSPYDKGLSNFPKIFPEGSMLIVNDQMPPQGHDPARIGRQLSQWVSDHRADCVLLDLQRPGNEETRQIVSEILACCPCPVGVSHPYAKGYDCPVFLPATPLNHTLADHLQPWQGREIWLEIALDRLSITVDSSGSQFQAVPFDNDTVFPHKDEALHCAYQIALSHSSARFTLQRTPENLNALMQEAAHQGVCKAIGLYQELASGDFLW